jgi:hypothetical protein
MSDQQNQQQQQNKAQRTVIAPFTVECADNRSRTIQVTTLRQQFPGRWDKSNVIGQGVILGLLPPIIPGVRLTVSPRDRTVHIHDPLGDDPALCRIIEKAQHEGQQIRNAFGSTVGKRVETRTQKLDEHETKTLLLEIARSVHTDNEDAVRFIVIKGAVPTEQELADFSGKELYDMMSNNPHKPKFKEDAEAWEKKLDQTRNEVGV